MTVLELANPLIIQGVAQGSLDVGVAIGGDDDPAVTTRPLYEDRLMLACGKDHPLAAVKAVPLASLARETLALLTDDFVTRRELDLFFSLHGVAPRRIVSLNTFASILSLVEVSVCVSVIPTWRDRPGLSMNVRFVPLTPAPSRRLTSVALPASGGHAPASDMLVRSLAKRFTSSEL